MNERSTVFVPANSSGNASTAGDIALPRCSDMCASASSFRPSCSSSKWRSNCSTASPAWSGWYGSVAPQTFSRSFGSWSSKNSTKPEMRSAFVNIT